MSGLSTSSDDHDDRSHAPRGNAALDALRPPLKAGRGASQAAFPRRAWERSGIKKRPRPFDRGRFSFSLS
ncbi:hypothetical protein BFW91_14415 [Pseudomonas fluorescens]|nr:hypothetical protein BFW91_14415 [Pseudomonas fluorescens]PQB02177.1 hypothetical protein B0A76_05115 [Pseudomonas fluorescens]